MFFCQREFPVKVYQFHIELDIILGIPTHSTSGDVELAQLVRARGVPLGTGVRILVTAITFCCAVIHFPIVYNLQRHQTPVPLIPCLVCMVWEVKDPLNQ